MATGPARTPGGVHLDLEPDDSALAGFARQVRRLTEATVRTEAGPDVLAAVADELRSVNDQLAEQLRLHSAQLDQAGADRAGLPYRRAPVLGGANPLAPPVELVTIDGEVRATARLHAAYEGPPGYVHGGFVALLLDDLLGLANIVAGVPGVTIGLDVRYRRPTPLDTELTVHAVHDRIEGRDAVAVGTISVAGEITASAEATFRRMSTERIRANGHHVEAPRSGRGPT